MVTFFCFPSLVTVEYYSSQSDVKFVSDESISIEVRIGKIKDSR